MGELLKGIRVIDFAQGWWAAAGTLYLADAGAEVIKLESLDGDTTRNPDSIDNLPKADWNYYFEYNNRNKKSLAVDLRAPRGREIACQLIDRSDVFISNLPEDRLEAQGFDYETLSQRNPRLIYGLASGFGAKGPDRELPAINELAASRTGAMPMLGEPGFPPPYIALGEPEVAVEIAYGVTVALYHRQRTGEGQRVDASLLGANLYLWGLVLQSYIGLQPGEQEKAVAQMVEPVPRLGGKNPLLSPFPTKDRWVHFSMPQTDRYWSAFCKGLGLEHLEHDPRFDSHDRRCGEFRRELACTIEETLLTKTAAEWEERWKGLGLLYLFINNFAELAVDPQTSANRSLIEVDSPAYGKIAEVGFPVQFSKTPFRLRSMAPALGQHTVEVLSDVLGYSLDDIVALREANVIRV